MVSTGQIRWKELKEYMDVLLPDWSQKEGKHRSFIRFGGQTAKLPKGAHGRTNPEIELGHVKTMFRQFEKLDEARRLIPQLR